MKNISKDKYYYYINNVVDYIKEDANKASHMKLNSKKLG